MDEALANIHVTDGDPVAPEHIPTALTAEGFVHGDGATQVFEPNGVTTYVEHGRSLRKAESPASGSPNSPRDHASTVVTGDPCPPRLRADHACARPWARAWTHAWPTRPTA